MVQFFQERFYDLELLTSIIKENHKIETMQINSKII